MPDETGGTIVMILAGGEGQRLHPLTRDRAKPAVPFGGLYRIVDFPLSNCLNSGLRRIHLLTQYKSFSLDRHVRRAWGVFSADLGEYVHPVPPQQRAGGSWYLGTADAIYQNVYLLERERPARVLILAGDHVYKMDYRAMLARHLAAGAAVTVACVPVERGRARAFGVAQVDGEGRITGFTEKPSDPEEIPGRPGWCLASMGIYVFETPELVRRVAGDARRESAHDFGTNILPEMVGEGARVFAYDFGASAHGAYWRDIGQIDAYFEANMDLVQVEPELDLYDEAWPIRTHQPQRPPVKSVFGDLSPGGPGGPGGRAGFALDSLVSAGCILSGARAERSVLSPGVHLHSHAHVEDSILMDDVDIGRGARVRRAIIDKGVRVPAGETIGLEAARDAERFVVSPGGVVVVPKEMPFLQEPASR